MHMSPGRSWPSSFLSLAAGIFLIFLAAGSVRTVAAAAALSAPTSSSPLDEFAPLDVPSRVITKDEEAAKRLPWILIVDEPQCPYCMQLHLALAAHIITDAFCLQASGLNGRWSAASYLDWLIAGPWKAEPGWSGATMEDLAAPSPPISPIASGSPGASGGAPAGGSAPPREQCLAGCTERFVSARYRQFSKVHSACLLEAGPQSAHTKTAAAVSWAAEHKVPGTPTVYAAHPSIGFRMLGDSDNLVDFMALLRRTLPEARARIRLTAKAH